jgi:hypothetical protein
MERYYSRGVMSWLGAILTATFLPAYENCLTAAPVTAYSTQFEQAQGYNPTFTLVGQGGWQGSDDTSVCNGLVSGIFPGLGQHAYIGFFPANQSLSSYNVWRPIDLAAIPTNTPVVKFSAQMAIIDSTTTNRDCFRWSVYNVSQKRLFSLDFDNEGLTINYLLEDGATFISTGRQFTNDIRYALEITMDFGRNIWSASLGDVSLTRDQPITTANSTLNLGDIDAVWVYRQNNSPGDNWMVFDNYTVTLEPRQDPTLSALGHFSGQFSLRLAGQANRDYAIEVSSNLVSGWLALRTNNTSSAGFFDFVDAASPALPRRFYRGRLVP